MTQAELRQKVVSIPLSWVGAKKGSSTHHQIVDIYNSHTPLPREVRMSYTMDWCATTTSAVAIVANLTDIMPVECSCWELIKQAEALGCWVENDAYIPKPADLILYAWSDDGKGDCTKAANHVGMVTDVTGSIITVVEGNMGSDSKVGIRKININGRYIRGYICPNYASVVNKPTKTDAETTKDEDKESENMIYGTLKDVPRYYQEAVRKAMERGALQGVIDGDTTDIEEKAINVSEDLCRILTVLDRMGFLDTPTN